MDAISAPTLALGICAFVLGGLVKGTLGIGLPMVAVPLLSLGVPATRAMVLVMVSVLVSNLWQMRASGISAAGVRRFLPLIAALLVSTVITVPLTLALPETTLRRLLALVVLLALALNALPLHLQVPPAQERWWSLAVGTASGILGGVSSLTGPIIISYLMSLRMAREVFVGSISVIYLVGAMALYASMAVQGRIGGTDLLWSTLALLPMAVGLVIGQRLRGHLSEAWFRRVLLAFLGAVALTLLLR